jgi:hypothetical protein
MTLPQALLGQTTVADIEPQSRYTTGAADRARITSTLLFQEPVDAGDLGDALEGATVGLDRSGLVATVLQEIDVPQQDNGIHALHTDAPLRGLDLIKNGDASMIVLLPRAAVYPTGPVFEVDLVSVQGEGVEPVVFGTGLLPPIGGRIAVAYWIRQDPGSLVEYAYRTIRDNT